MDGRGEGRIGGGPPERTADDVLRAYRGTASTAPNDRHRCGRPVHRQPDDIHRRRRHWIDAGADAPACPRPDEPEHRDPVLHRDEELPRAGTRGAGPAEFQLQRALGRLRGHVQVAFFLAVVTGSPVIVYELGQFIGPALKPSERRLVVRITVPVLLLFLSGVLLCFIVVLPFTFNLLFSVQNLLGANLLILYGDSFIDFVLLFTVAFGLAFQLPVLMYGLSALGIVSSEFWKKYWRFAAIAIFLFGAIITPDGSGITMFLVALPMLAL